MDMATNVEAAATTYFFTSSKLDSDSIAQGSGDTRYI
jgi:hypothetical protein